MGGRIQFDRAAAAYIEDLATRGYSPATVRSRRHTIAAFVRLAGIRRKAPLADVTRTVAERAMRRLVARYDAGTAWKYAQDFMQFFRVFAATGLVLENPLAWLPRPRKPKKLVDPILTREEMARLLAAVPVGRPSGVRDRAILEVFYSTAVRLAECARLEVRDLDLRDQNPCQNASSACAWRPV